LRKKQGRPLKKKCPWACPLRAPEQHAEQSPQLFFRSLIIVI